MKIAVVTGASSGLGREFVLMIPKLYENLDEIWITARRTDRLKELQDQLMIPVRIFPGDLTKTAVYNHMQKELEEKHPRIRILVNAAGSGRIGSCQEIALKDQLDMIDLNCRGLTRMTLMCLPYMNRGSRIIETASAAAFAPEPYFGTYAATKSYVYSFSRSLNYELRRQGISVTALCPGPVHTEFFDHAGHEGAHLRGMPAADPEKVVRQALKDAVKRKPISIYGMTMKLAYVAARILPTSLILDFMGTHGADGEEDG